MTTWAYRLLPEGDQNDIKQALAAIDMMVGGLVKTAAEQLPLFPEQQQDTAVTAPATRPVTQVSEKPRAPRKKDDKYFSGTDYQPRHGWTAQWAAIDMLKDAVKTVLSKAKQLAAAKEQFKGMLAEIQAEFPDSSLARGAAQLARAVPTEEQRLADWFTAVGNRLTSVQRSMASIRTFPEQGKKTPNIIERMDQQMSNTNQPTGTPLAASSGSQMQKTAADQLAALTIDLFYGDQPMTKEAMQKEAIWPFNRNKGLPTPQDAPPNPLKAPPVQQMAPQMPAGANPNVNSQDKVMALKQQFVAMAQDAYEGVAAHKSFQQYRQKVALRLKTFQTLLTQIAQSQGAVGRAARTAKALLDNLKSLARNNGLTLQVLQDWTMKVGQYIQQMQGGAGVNQKLDQGRYPGPQRAQPRQDVLTTNLTNDLGMSAASADPDGKFLKSASKTDLWVWKLA